MGKFPEELSGEFRENVPRNCPRENCCGVKLLWDATDKQHVTDRRKKQIYVRQVKTQIKANTKRQLYFDQLQKVVITTTSTMSIVE